jgi:hypothetical protein
MNNNNDREELLWNGTSLLSDRRPLMILKSARVTQEGEVT